MLLRLYIGILMIVMFIDANTLVKNSDVIVPLTVEEKNYLDSKPHLNVASLSSREPFNFLNQNKPDGYSIDVVNLMGKYLNKKINYINKPWSEHLEALKNGKLDIIPGIAVTEDRKKFVDYTDFTHVNFVLGLLTKKPDTIRSIDDLSGKKLVVINKSFLYKYLKNTFPKIELIPASTLKDAIDKVSNGSAFALMSNIATLNYYIQKKWLVNLQLQTIDDLNLPYETKLKMGVTKGNKLLKSILDKAHDLIPQGELNSLQIKWMNVQKAEVSLTLEEKLYLNKKKKLLMCVLPDWLPFEQIDENGIHKGIGADIMQIISKKIDIPIELVPTKQWSDSLQNLNDRKCDILPVAMDVPSRRNTMNFTTPYISEPFVIATQSNEFFIKNAKELVHRKIGVVKSFAFINVLKRKYPYIEIIDVVNTKDGLEKVREGKIFGYIDTLPTISYWIQKHSMLDLKIAGKLEFDILLSIASRNDEPLLSSIMQKSIDTISSEKRRSIIGKWVTIKVAREFDYTILLQISFIFFTIIIIILYKNNAVNKINKKLILANKSIEEQKDMVDKYVLILTTDLKGIITEVNKAYCKEIGYSKTELIGKTHSIIRDPSIQDKFFEKMWNAIENDKIWKGEIRNLTKEGDFIWFFMNIEPIYSKGIKVGYRSISQNITDKKIIEKLSVTDQLTKLYNRHYLENAFVREIARSLRYKTSLSVMLIDIDHFKLVNDTYGHDIGDQTLKSLAQILEKNIRKIDTLGRWGGEEFIIIVPNTTAENTVVLAEKLRKAVESYPFKVLKHKTASFGVSTFQDDDTRESLIKKADEALYDAKEEGRNRVKLYSKV